jgi:hypothetical protein
MGFDTGRFSELKVEKGCHCDDYQEEENQEYYQDIRSFLHVSSYFWIIQKNCLFLTLFQQYQNIILILLQMTTKTSSSPSFLARVGRVGKGGAGWQGWGGDFIVAHLWYLNIALRATALSPQQS